MARRGRPTNPSKAKNRRHSVYLSEAAEITYRLIEKERNGSGWLHDYVSSCILRDFGAKKVDVLKRLRELYVQEHNRELERFETKLRRISKKIDKLESGDS